MVILWRTTEKGKPYCPGSLSKTVFIRWLFDQSGKLKRKPSGGERADVSVCPTASVLRFWVGKL
jgi:hypothetical protein